LPGSLRAGRVRGLAARKALQLFQELYGEYIKEMEESQDAAAARRGCEARMGRRYVELHATALELLRTVAEPQKCGGYSALSFRGAAVADRRRNLQARLALARQQASGQQREALCAVLAALCCRLQKNWLSAYDDEVPVRGYFAHGLVDPNCRFRVAVKSPSRLASLLVTSELPLARALAAMDHGGPFPEGHEKEPVGRRQYGLQRVCVETGYGEEQKERLCDVQPEAELRALMESQAPVEVLEVYCALAPKERVARHRLGPVIRAELRRLLAEAKERGRAVLFLVGGDHPIDLVQKVYLQPWFTSIGGLRCGYFRWKQSTEADWEPPKLMGQKRVIFGLQLP